MLKENAKASLQKSPRHEQQPAHPQKKRGPVPIDRLIIQQAILDYDSEDPYKARESQKTLQDLVAATDEYNDAMKNYKKASDGLAAKIKSYIKYRTNLNDAQRDAILEESEKSYADLHGEPEMLIGEKPMLDHPHHPPKGHELPPIPFREREQLRREMQQLQPLNINAFPFSNDTPIAAAHGLPALPPGAKQPKLG